MTSLQECRRDKFDPAGDNGYLRESSYEQHMQSYVEPLWQEGEHGMFQGAGGTMLTYHYIMPVQPKAAIVVIPGTSETILKYKEFCYDAVRFGYAVFLFDHRGHGLSGRLCANTDIVHVDQFAYYVDDVRGFIQDIVRPQYQGPLMLFGHSLGGLIAADLLVEDNRQIMAAVLNAPMFDINLNGVPRALARGVTRCLAALGGKERYSFGQKPAQGSRTIQESGTSSEVRFTYYYRQLRQDPSRLLMGGVSHGWLSECLRASAGILSSPGKIVIPVLVIAAGRDRFVGIEGQRHFMAHTLRGEFAFFENAAHESFNDTDAVRIPVMNRIFSFFETHYNPQLG